jgi:endonuclease-3
MESNNLKIDWGLVLKPLIEKYRGEKHPLNYHSIYELMVMVILSAQTTDDLINDVTPPFFKKFPDFKSLSKAKHEELIPYLSKVRNFFKKSDWILEIAQLIKEDKNIPTTIEALVDLKGIGRKSANVIMREAKLEAEGIICDLHVIRVAERLGLTEEKKDGNKVEKDLMQKLPKKIWGDVGMALSFLGRDTCRPTNPKHEECPLNKVCEYCLKNNHGS